MSINLDVEGIIRATEHTFGDSIREDIPMRLGDPTTGRVPIDLASSDMAGMVYVHSVGGENLIPQASRPDDSEENKVFVTGALLLPNRIPQHLVRMGTPVRVRQRGRIYEVYDLDGIAGAEFTYGVEERATRAIDISQLDYGLIRPNFPMNRQVLVTAARYTIDNVIYAVPTLLSDDLVDAYLPFNLGVTQAVAVLIEVDPVAQTLHYTANIPFADAGGHDRNVVHYPNTITPGRFAAGWVVLRRDMTVINPSHIYCAMQVYSQGSGGGVSMPEIAARIVVDACGDVVTSGGQIVWTEEI